MTRNKNETRQRCKKSQNDENANAKGTEKEVARLDSLDEEDQGFGGWLRSPDGLENMKLFVIANSIVLLMTLMYPQVQLIVDFIYDSIYGPDNDLIV
ncbi:PREDICTED: uncharacterized protein LOC106101973 [Papilio polytes]|uniref:uncharacterized protein LOC106101973 n=1 Tax=Papilio polytes TaxID=76194 RepID=UPI0006767EB6|nr:PREDICTED: uncharacterized protein LOC106101973 [Papilio polytes]